MKYNIYTNELNINVFDIETTGLNPKTDIIISASFCREDGSDLRQYFCENPESELLLLSKIKEEFKNLEGIITYNGKKFDIPFIETRAHKYGFSFDAIPWNIDIYRYLKGYWSLASEMKSLSQSAVEEALGLTDKRTDTISGAECISLYNQYYLSRNEQYKNLILLHNSDDVKQLGKISESLSFLDFHKIVFLSGRQIFKYFDDKKLRITVDPINFVDGKLIINASLKSGLMPIAAYEEYYSLDYDVYSGAAKLVLKPKEIDNFMYIDLCKMPVNSEDYYNFKGFNNNYLIIQDKNNIYYREINKLVEDILLKI